jgi:hypothetical protein
MFKKEKHTGELREKYWCELTTEEKIERIREMFKRQMNNIRYINNIINKLKTHKHNAEGMPIIEEVLNYIYGWEEQVGVPLTKAEKKDEVYF